MSDKENKQVTEAFQKANQTTKDFTLYEFKDIKKVDAVDSNPTDDLHPMTVTYQNNKIEHFEFTPKEFKKILGYRSNKEFQEDSVRRKQIFNSQGAIVRDLEGSVYIGKDEKYVKLTEHQYQELSGGRSDADVLDSLNSFDEDTGFLKAVKGVQAETYLLKELGKPGVESKQSSFKEIDSIDKDPKVIAELEAENKRIQEIGKQNKVIKEKSKIDFKKSEKQIKDSENIKHDKKNLKVKDKLNAWKESTNNPPSRDLTKKETIEKVNSKKLVLEKKETKKDIEDYVQFSFVAKRNSAIQLMIDRGPDFMNNAFDVIILCTPKIEHEKRIQGYGGQPMVDFFDEFHKVNEVFGDDLSAFNTLGDSMGFATRINNINIPQPVSETFELPFLFTKIKKVRSKVNFTKKQTIEAFLDEPMFFATIFDLISNNNRMTLEYGKNPTHWAPFSTTLKSRDGIYNKSIRIDIYVKQLVLLHDSFRDKILSFEDTEENVYGGVNTQKQQLGLKPEATPYWCFEDVNFMGQAKQLTFDHTSQSPLTGEFPFIFKRLYKVDMQKRDAEINKKRISESIFQPYKPTLDLYPNITLNR